MVFDFVMDDYVIFCFIIFIFQMIEFEHIRAALTLPAAHLVSRIMRTYQLKKESRLRLRKMESKSIWQKYYNAF